MDAINTKSQSGKALNTLRALAEKFESLGDFQKKALEYLALFIALAIAYSPYLKNTYCPARPSAIHLDLLYALKFFLITSWPIVVMASLDTTWEGKNSAHVSLAAFAAATAFWIRIYGGGYCIFCLIYELVAFTFSTGFAHGLGITLRSIPPRAKYVLIAGSLFAFIAAQTFNHLRARASQTPAIAAAAAPAVPVKAPVANVTPTADYSATAQKAAETPHFWQLDPRGGFLNGGKDYCGPVAVSDSLVYLGHHGFPDLLPGCQGDQAQIDMINELASPHYLGTDPNAGTGSASVLRGIEKYVVSCGYQCSTMEYEGWTKMGSHEREFVMADRPDLNWMKKGILNPNGAVWLVVGWYNRAGDGQWKRAGGHWVTMVGFDAKDPNTLLIHNPGTRGNGGQPDNPAQDVIHLTPVNTGTLVTDNGQEVDAFGRYRISGPGLPVARGRIAILDAAIVVVISKL